MIAVVVVVAVVAVMKKMTINTLSIKATNDKHVEDDDTPFPAGN